MKITVILCTYNRCESLSMALESVALSSLPASVEWDVLVVDNNSRDLTRPVVEKFCQRFPKRFKYVFEARQGKSFALNRGIREAAGDVLVFIDDDITVEPNWLFELTKPLSDSQWAGDRGKGISSEGFFASVLDGI